MSCCEMHILKALRREREEGVTLEILRILRKGTPAGRTGAFAEPLRPTPEANFRVTPSIVEWLVGIRAALGGRGGRSRAIRDSLPSGEARAD